MHLADTLGLDLARPNPLQRAGQLLASTAPGAWALSKTLHHLDRLLLRTSDGRFSLPGLMTGVPAVLLTTTGARTGLARRTPLVAIPHGPELILLGTGWGQDKTPGWVANLQANPRATVAADGVEIVVVARRATPEEEPLLWEKARSVYPGYAKYPVRAAHRHIAVFVVGPAP